MPIHQMHCLKKLKVQNVKVNMKQLQHKLNRGLRFRLFIFVSVSHNEVIYLNRVDPAWFAAMQSAAHYSNASLSIGN